MKFNKSLLLFGASALLLTACGEGTETPADVTSVDTASEVSSAVESVESVESVDSTVEKAPADTSREIVLGQPMEVGDYIITIQSYGLGVDYDGKDALIINYDWTNNSDEAASPFMTFILKGFQDGIETSDVFMVDGVDLGIGQKEVRPGSTLEGAQDIIGVDDLSKPIELEIDELMTFDSNPYTAILDLSTLQ